MKYKVKIALLAAMATISVIVAIAVGSVYIPFRDIIIILADRLFGTGIPETVRSVFPAMIMEMRLPRVCLAFLTGASLALSGTVMQSILQNPLASPFNLGISSGAGFGAAIVVVTGLAAGSSQIFLLPLVSMMMGLLTVFFVLWTAERVDRGFSNLTIILIGMVASLFFNALMNLLATLSPAYAQRINLWLLGSFSMRQWFSVWILLPITVLCLVLFLCLSRELDIMTFGEEQAQVIGVNMTRYKKTLICVVAILTATTVSFVGVIGFVDLIAPHIIRRIFGPSHRKVLPASALFGGSFLVLCDLAARTIAAPREIPIGSITALLGVPFFLYIYFGGKRSRSP